MVNKVNSGIMFSLDFLVLNIPFLDCIISPMINWPLYLTWEFGIMMFGLGNEGGEGTHLYVG